MTGAEFLFNKFLKACNVYSDILGTMGVGRGEYAHALLFQCGNKPLVHTRTAEV